MDSDRIKEIQEETGYPHSIIVLRALNSAGLNPVNQGFVNVYPNPIQKNFNLEVSPQYLGGTIDLIDVFGKSVYESKVLNLNTTFDGMDIAKGLYILKVSNGSEEIITRIVVE